MSENVGAGQHILVYFVDDYKPMKCTSIYLEILYQQKSNIEQNKSYF